jgi:hypothetical protein
MQLKACTPFASTSVSVSGSNRCAITIRCGAGGDTVGGLQSLEAVIQHGAVVLERFNVASAPYENSVVSS